MKLTPMKLLMLCRSLALLGTFWMKSSQKQEHSRLKQKVMKSIINSKVQHGDWFLLNKMIGTGLIMITFLTMSVITLSSTTNFTDSSMQLEPRLILNTQSSWWHVKPCNGLTIRLESIIKYLKKKGSAKRSFWIQPKVLAVKSF